MRKGGRKILGVHMLLCLTMMLLSVFTCKVLADVPYIPITEENFPDNNFRNCLLEKYSTTIYGDDGIYVPGDIEYLDLREKNISNLKGIENFILLERLSCENNNLTSLDVSQNPHLKNLFVNGNKLSNLDVSSCGELEYLYVNDNQLTSLNVSGLSSLKSLDASNNQLKSLNTSSLSALQSLQLYGNQLTSLDLRICTALEQMDVSDNQLTSLDVSACSQLKDYLEAYGNPLTSLAVNHCLLLEGLNVGATQITSLDVSGLSHLTRLTASDSPKLSSLNVKGCSALEDISVENTQLTSLDVRSCSALDKMYLKNNQLSSLYVKGVSTLRLLYVENNQLTSLDVSGCQSLSTLNLRNNAIKKLDVSQCSVFTEMMKQRGGAGYLASAGKRVARVISGFNGDSNRACIECDLSVTVIYDGGTIPGETADETDNTQPSDPAGKQKNTISAKDVVRPFSLKKQTFALKATAKGGAKLTYKSGNSGKISVDKTGKITVKKAYVGYATITITAAATDQYEKTVKKITVTVNPGVADIISATNSGEKQMAVKWKKTASTKSTGYEIRYSTKKNFAKNATKTVKVAGVKTTSTKITGLKQGKRYYVQVRTFLTSGKRTYYSAWSKKKSVKISK